jgi:hypothetical protein
MAIVDGWLNASLLQDGTIKVCFSTEPGDELCPKREKNLDTAEQDFITTYKLTPAKAAEFRALIKREGSASIPTAI